jgi:hypothetical protein
MDSKSGCGSSSGAVVLGVIFEFWTLFHEYSSERNEWIEGSIKSTPKPSLGKLAFEVAGVLLVVVGVAGELWVGVISGNRNTALRNKNNRLVSIIQQESETLRKQAEDEALARAMLETRFRPIGMGKIQQDRLVDALSGIPGTSIALIFCASRPNGGMNPSAISLMDPLMSSKPKSSGWNFIAIAADQSLGLPGVIVVVKRGSDSQTRKTATNLLSALDRSGVPAWADADFSIEPGRLPYGIVETIQHDAWDRIKNTNIWMIVNEPQP